MEAEIYTWIRNIVVYMMINTIIMNLLGNKSYKKYVSIASGMILILIVVSPLVKVLKLEENLDYFLESYSFSMDTTDFKNELSLVEDRQAEKISLEYQKQVKAQVKEILQKDQIYLQDMEVQIDMNTKSETYGQITGMKISATTEQNKAAAGKRLMIDQVLIEQVTIGEEARNELKKLPSAEEIRLKNKLSDFYNMDQGNINISIQGG